MERLMSAHRRAALLKVALRAYRAQKGKYPEKLDALVHDKYLERLPSDPYSNQQPFGYRVCREAGEKLVTLPPRPSSDRSSDSRVSMSPTISILPGQAIIWSVGQDQIDHGGHSVPVAISSSLTRPEDLVYLVPMGQDREP